jgi:mannose-6-phosphate isomerase
MERLHNPVRHYAWGSHTAIAAMQGRAAPTPEAEAELWLGAHPASPSALSCINLGLDRAIVADPAGLLGLDVVARFGPRLPFLLKVLAADEPLSLQAHPNAAQAAAGFATEEAAGTPAQSRNYVDASHKPELLVAVEEFDALCGFRAPEESARTLEALDVPGLKSTVDALRRGEPCEALRDAVAGLLTLPAADREALVSAVAAAAARRDEPEYTLVNELAELYPGDIGVLIALLLNRVRLAPGEAVFMAAGILHAYLHGVAIEVMAASDNVLRGGLTPKRVDVSELLRVLRFEVTENPVRRPVDVAPGVVTWPVPVPDFALFRATAAERAIRLPGLGPRVVLCLRGEVSADDGIMPVRLRAGEGGFAPAGSAEISLAGNGEVYQATCSAGTPDR